MPIVYLYMMYMYVHVITIMYSHVCNSKADSVIVMCGSVCVTPLCSMAVTFMCVILQGSSVAAVIIA